MSRMRSTLFSLTFLSFLGAADWAAAAEGGAAPAEVFRRAEAQLQRINLDAMQRAIQDLIATFPEGYPHGAEWLVQVSEWQGKIGALKESLAQADSAALLQVAELARLQESALLANPLLQFDRLLLVKRKPIGDPRRAEDPDRGVGKFIGLPQQSSWQLHTMPNPMGWENEIAVLSPVRPDGAVTRLFAPSNGELVSDVDLHFAADRMLFSMPDARRLWQLYEIDGSGGGLRQLTPGEESFVHNLDGCYLPNGKIAFVSTAAIQGVPCNAGVIVGMTYLLDPQTRQVRQLCFEQDHNFCPTVLNDGRLLYLRWEYTEIPHVWARFLFSMNPDGTTQREYYGSGSYWPNAIFYARPIPNHPTKVVGIVTGHHVGRVGELIVFDPAKSRDSSHGVVQRIPGFGKEVVPLIEDKLTMDSWPKFVHPYPLSEKYFLVTAKPGPKDLWGIYLADIFDNLVLVKELEGCALLEPVPFRPTPAPPIIPERVHPDKKEAVVYLEDIYSGPGLAGVPRGLVKKLRLFTYHFAYEGVAGINHRVGSDGPWEPKRVLGTVPVQDDGSAFFQIPANTPISIQPLDDSGHALQWMRSWLTAMPGEIVSCTGCHENQNSSPANGARQALAKAPAAIEPWHGPVRGFSFAREVQPALDRHCVSCHDGAAGAPFPDLRADQGRYYCYKNGDPVGTVVSGVRREDLIKKYGGVFEPSYIELRRFVRVGGLESDLRLLNPGEFHANTTELVQLLRKGHHGVDLDADAWDRLVTWIDLNAPCHGRWTDIVGAPAIAKNAQRRRELRLRYAGLDDNPEEFAATSMPPSTPVLPAPAAPVPFAKVECPGWPFDAQEAARRQSAAGRTRRTVDLGNGVSMELVLVPAGPFVMGDVNGAADEKPVSRVQLTRSFWMGRFEVSNQQYAQFSPNHDSRFEDMSSWIFTEEGLGWALNHPQQPVVRVSWNDAQKFCAWLADRLGEKVFLPSEAEWEYACRAGTATAFSFGPLDADFSSYANLADANLRRLAYDARDQYSPDLAPRDARFNDRHLVTADAGMYQPNAWGLHDMHGNAWEWTRSDYAAYPYRDQSDEVNLAAEKVVRGGSWYDRPQRARSAFRLSYPVWQKVFNVSFRIVIPVEKEANLTSF